MPTSLQAPSGCLACGTGRDWETAPGSGLVQVRPRLTTSNQRGTRGACQAGRQENATKDVPVGRREVKLSPCADDTSLYRENCKESILKTISK